MKKVFTKNNRVRVQTINDEKSLTEQQFKEQCDANNIIAKYKATGQITHLARQQGVYADVSDITDYHESYEKVLKAQSAFDTLPSEVRLRFNNDPAELLNFLNNPQNFEEGVKLGLYDKPKHDQPLPIQNDPNEQKTSKGKSKTVVADQSPSED